MDASSPPPWSPAMNSGRIPGAGRLAEKAGQVEESFSVNRDAPSTSDPFHGWDQCSAPGPVIALLHPAPGSQHESTLLGGETVATTGTPSQKRRKRSQSSQRKFPETRSKVEGSPKRFSPGSDIEDSGYVIKVSEMDSDCEVGSDRPNGRLAKKAKLVPMGLAPTSQTDSNVDRNLVQIRSCAQLIAQDSQPLGLGLSPTLGELRGREDSDLPADIKRWIHLSTITGIYGDHQTLPPHFSRIAPHLFTLHDHQKSAHASRILGPFAPVALYTPESFASSFPLAPDVRTLAYPSIPFSGFYEPGKTVDVNLRESSKTNNAGAIGPLRSRDTRCMAESGDETSEAPVAKTGT